MRILKKMNYIFNKRQKTNLIILLMLIIISAFLELIGVAIILPFISLLLDTQEYMKKGIVMKFCSLFSIESEGEFIIFLSVAIIIAYIIKNIFLIFKDDLQFKFTFNNQRRLSNDLMRCYIYQPYLFHIKHNSAELIRNVLTDTQTFYKVVLALLQLISELSISFVLFIFLFFTDKAITIGIAFLFVIYSVFYTKGSKKKRTEFGKQNRRYQAEMNKSLYQAFGGIKEIKLTNREEYFANSYNKNLTKSINILRKDNLLAVISKPLLETLCVSMVFLAICLKVVYGSDLKSFVPILSAFAVAAFKLMPSFNRIISYMGTIVFGSPSVESVFEDLVKLNELEKEEIKQEAQGSDFSIQDKIYLRNITFRYPTGDDNIIENVNLEIKKNTSIAFIGPSGAGKTTLIDIFLGILKPQSGQIFADEINVLQNPYGWHKKIGYIPQSIYLTDDTIRRNVAFGYNDSEICDELVWKALELAQLKEYIVGIEDGIDTVIGESGLRFSGGQRQRIGIARALYLNPEILVLDEATSALDNDTESAIMDAINQLAGMKTIIIIAHRLSTIEKCDVIYKVENKGITRVNNDKDRGL